MITEQQLEVASLYALGALDDAERAALDIELRTDPHLRAVVLDLQRTIELFALTAPALTPPAGLRGKILQQIGAGDPATPSKPQPPAPAPAGLRFLESADQKAWKALPVPGAFIKLLTLERERGYAILLGKLDAGARYPAHKNAGPEDFYVLTGDLMIGERKLVAGDFHHADAGSHHAENYSVGGCTLIAVLTSDDPLVAFAMA